MTVYVTTEVEAGDTIRWGNWSDRVSTYYDQTQPLTLIEGTSGSDYSGGTVERSNYDALLADQDVAPYLVQIVGGHGTYGLAYLGTEDDAPDAIRDVVAALADYPLIDDSAHSELEHNLEIEAWESYGRRDFEKALLAHVNDLRNDVGCEELDELGLTEDGLYELWRQASDHHGDSGRIFETGGSVYFYTDDIVKIAHRKGLIDYVCMGWLPVAVGSEEHAAIEVMCHYLYTCFGGAA